MIILLIAWSVAAFVWWGIALWLLAATRHQRKNGEPTPEPSQGGNPSVQRPAITVFKPLPPVRDEHERRALTDAIESFAAQLLPGDELIVGINVDHAAGWSEAVPRWQHAGRGARIEVVTRPLPVQCANPKIAWLEVLAPQARAEWWLWSDADVVAPAGLLNALGAALSQPGNHAATAAYRIERVNAGREVLDALFVNVEFLPGALLLGRLGKKDFAYGAAILFRAGTFRERVSWAQLGATLADDHKLGALLQPVALAPVLASTFAQPANWRAAWEHYYRWQKTVRWCRPGGFAALLVLMPAWGWSLAALGGVTAPVQLAGLGAVMGGEMLVGLLACRLVGCRLPVGTWLGVALWPFTRPVVWLLVWLPLPVLWSGRRREWFAPVEK